MPDLALALRAVMPPGVVVADGRDDPPWPGEAVPAAIPARQTEFAKGRSAARAALRQLDLPPAAIPMGLDRAPVWPAGVTGSISHCAGACCAVAGLSAVYAGLGLDLEPDRPLDPVLWPTILHPGDRIGPVRGASVLAIFVAKEAAYKAQYAVTGQLFDFQTLCVSWDEERFSARFTVDVRPFAKGQAIEGRMLRTAGFIAAVCAIKAS